MAREEIIFKLSMLEQQSEEIKKNLEELDGQSNDLDNLKQSLEKLGSDKGKEILANLGRGVFLKSKASDEKVFVNVGSKILVRKSFSEASEIIDKQLVEIEIIKKDLMNNLNSLNLELQDLVEQAQKEKD